MIPMLIQHLHHEAIPTPSGDDASGAAPACGPELPVFIVVRVFSWTSALQRKSDLLESMQSDLYSHIVSHIVI